MYVCVCVCVCVCGLYLCIIVYGRISDIKYVCVCVKIHVLWGKFEAVSWIYESQSTAKVYYAYKSKLYFLCNALMMIVSSLVKITNTHSHTYTQVLFSQTVATLVTHCISYIQETTSNLLRGAYIFIHTLNITYTTTHNNTQI